MSRVASGIVAAGILMTSTSLPGCERNQDPFLLDYAGSRNASQAPDLNDIRELAWQAHELCKEFLGQDEYEHQLRYSKVRLADGTYASPYRWIGESAPMEESRKGSDAFIYIRNWEYYHDIFIIDDYHGARLLWDQGTRGFDSKLLNAIVKKLSLEEVSAPEAREFSRLPSARILTDDRWDSASMFYRFP